ncbi:hypothetical protein AB5I41_12835 [Sphingomonas sp. MMS24-JH45]
MGDGRQDRNATLDDRRPGVRRHHAQLHRSPDHRAAEADARRGVRLGS